MKHYIIIIYTLVAVLTATLSACSDDDLSYTTHSVDVTIADSTGTPIAREGFAVSMTDSHGSVYRQTTNANGTATFHLPDDIYQATASKSEVRDARSLVYNGVTSNIIVNSDVTAKINVSVTESGTIIIKEIYVGGCRRDDGSGTFQRDKYIILYNNCPQTVTLSNLCIGITTPFNAYGINNNYGTDGRLNYADADFIPAFSAIWYLPGGMTFAPYQQMVIALNGAVDHTATYSNSINFADSSYYCTYDPLRYNSTMFYPSPSSLIPTSHYLRAVKFGDEGEDAWPLSTSSPAIFVFSLDNETPEEFGANADNIYYDGGVASVANTCKKVPRRCILDGVEVYSSTSTYNEKRLTPDIDAGYIMHTPRQGHALLRKTDTQATASAGHTVYIDTNNSTNDFEQLDRASLATKK